MKISKNYVMSSEVFKIVIFYLPFVIFYLSFFIQARAFDKSFKGAKRVSITIVSSNINVIFKI